MVNYLVKVVNIKSVHLDEVLDEVQRVGRVWFENFLIEGLKVGKILKRSHVTIIICELGNSFIFILICFFFIQLMFLSVEMV